MVDLGLKMLLHYRIRFAITVLGVAFAVTLVLVQSGLLLGLLDNASVSIERPLADLWITSRNTPNVDFAHIFPEGYVQRVRSIPGVARADDLIVTFNEVSMPSGAQEGMLIYALEDFRGWNLPWEVVEGDLADLRRGGFFMLDDSATRRYGPFATGEHREIMGHRLEIVGRTRGARSFTTTPIAFMDFRRAQELNPGHYGGNTTYILVKLAEGADAEVVKAEVGRRLPYNDVYTKAEWAARSRSYWIANTGLVPRPRCSRQSAPNPPGPTTGRRVQLSSVRTTKASRTRVASGVAHAAALRARTAACAASAARPSRAARSAVRTQESRRTEPPCLPWIRHSAVVVTPSRRRSPARPLRSPPRPIAPSRTVQPRAPAALDEQGRAWPTAPAPA